MLSVIGIPAQRSMRRVLLIRNGLTAKGNSVSLNGIEVIPKRTEEYHIGLSSFELDKKGLGITKYRFGHFKEGKCALNAL